MVFGLLAMYFDEEDFYIGVHRRRKLEVEMGKLDKIAVVLIILTLAASVLALIYG